MKDERIAYFSMEIGLDAGIPTIVYGDDVDDLVETGLRAQGVRKVIDRHDFVADPARFVPRLA